MGPFGGLGASSSGRSARARPVLACALAATMCTQAFGHFARRDAAFGSRPHQAIRHYRPSISTPVSVSLSLFLVRLDSSICALSLSWLQLVAAWCM